MATNVATAFVFSGFATDPPMHRLVGLLQRFQRHAGGATAVEYGLFVALISVVVIVAVTTAGTSLYSVMNNLSAKIAGH